MELPTAKTTGTHFKIEIEHLSSTGIGKGAATSLASRVKRSPKCNTYWHH